jgi:hypothetical protein
MPLIGHAAFRLLMPMSVQVRTAACPVGAGLMLPRMVVDADDREVIHQCLVAAADGPFFPDWEFQTLMGFERDDIRRMAERWPDWDDDVEQSDAVNNVLNNLLGYPHGRWDAWHDYISPVSEDVARVYARWRGEDEPDASDKGYFDRLR